jgi:hypothetical protein
MEIGKLGASSNVSEYPSARKVFQQDRTAAPLKNWL